MAEEVRKVDMVKLSVLIPRSMYEDLEEISKEMGEPISVVVRNALRSYIVLKKRDRGPISEAEIEAYVKAFREATKIITEVLEHSKVVDRIVQEYLRRKMEENGEER